jgi:hypothetical protein
LLNGLAEPAVGIYHKSDGVTAPTPSSLMLPSARFRLYPEEVVTTLNSSPNFA